MRVRRSITSSQPLNVSLRLDCGWGWQRRVFGETGTVMSKSVTKDRRPPDRMNENLGIMRFHSVSTATIHAFVTDLDIPGPVMTPDGVLCLWTWVTVLCQDIGDTSVGSGGDTCGLRLSGEL